MTITLIEYPNDKDYYAVFDGQNLVAHLMGEENRHALNKDSLSYLQQMAKSHQWTVKVKKRKENRTWQ